MFFTSCQKEVNWNDDVKFCGVSTIIVRNASGAITEKFTFQYDTVRRRPEALGYTNFESGTSEQILPEYKADTIFYNANVYAVTDGTRRIKLLHTIDKSSGKALDYYYTYDTFGYLTQRIADDGYHDAARTNFTYDNGMLTGFQQDFQGYPLALSAVVSYEQSTRFNGYSEYSLIELFPELVLYMPTFQMGKMAAYAIKKVERHIDNTNLPPMNLTDNYSNYSLNTEGWPQEFQTQLVVSGTPALTSKYSFEYTCF
jgi:hypothetical protein